MQLIQDVIVPSLLLCCSLDCDYHRMVWAAHADKSTMQTEQSSTYVCMSIITRIQSALKVGFCVTELHCMRETMVMAYRTVVSCACDISRKIMLRGHIYSIAIKDRITLLKHCQQRTAIVFWCFSAVGKALIFCWWPDKPDCWMYVHPAFSDCIDREAPRNPFVCFLWY